MEQSLDSSLYIIIALLPLVAGLLVCQVSPYKALIIRGILGAVAALVYAVLGAADVALTEALVGTMLAITLYAVAVRSSMVMRLGVLEEDGESRDEQLMETLRTLLKPYQVRLERVTYPNWQALHQALMAKEIHGMCFRVGRSPHYLDAVGSMAGDTSLFHLAVRVRRLYELLGDGVQSATATIEYVDLGNEGDSKAIALEYPPSERVEGSL